MFRIIFLTLIVISAVVHASDLYTENNFYGKNKLTPLVQNATDNCAYINLGKGVRIKQCETANDQYQLTDHLGSTRVVVDNNNNVKYHCDYNPYGNPTVEIDEAQKQHCLYNSTYQYNQITKNYISPTRHYDSENLFFLRQDPLRQTWSAYSSFATNPINNVDKDGSVVVVYHGGQIPTPAAKTNMYYLPDAYNELKRIAGLSLEKYDEISNSTKISFYDDINDLYMKEAELHTTSEYGNLGVYSNTMDFETGELSFNVNYRGEGSNILATDVMRVQYLEATKYAGKEFMLPKSFKRNNITNQMALKVLDTYKYEYLSDDFFYDFMYNTDNGRSSLRVSDVLGLKVDSIEVVDNEPSSFGESVRMFLSPKNDLTERLQLPVRNLFRHPGLATEFNRMFNFSEMPFFE